MVSDKFATLRHVCNESIPGSPNSISMLERHSAFRLHGKLKSSIASQKISSSWLHKNQSDFLCYCIILSLHKCAFRLNMASCG